MSDFFPSERSPSANLHEFSVSELSGAIKRTIESTYDRVRVRGELGRVTIAKSGHMYADLKDDRAVINMIMWKGSVSGLGFRPEEGLEVVAEGKLSTYPGRSNYQLIADTLNPAGAGALMALLEERRKKLAAEGLFDAGRKQPLPKFPKVIGVVTSPTGAVIRDILHRISDRFPVHVLVWPALVQGERAAEQIAAGIKGFNALGAMSSVPRPDVLIVARGGGSIEDLWPFNEEVVVRAAAASEIPLISAVGHETDTTLIDFASDMRAPTPTGAAEIAVPVRAELMDDLVRRGQQLTRALTQLTRHSDRSLAAISARLPRPQTLLEARQQRFDYAEGRLANSLQVVMERKTARFDQTAIRLRPQALFQTLGRMDNEIDRQDRSLRTALRQQITRNQDRLQSVDRRLKARGQAVLRDVRDNRNLDQLADRLDRSMSRHTSQLSDRLSRASGVLEALSYHATLKRGFAVVMSRSGEVVRTAKTAEELKSLRVRFADGDVDVSTGSAPVSKPSKPAPKKGDQGSLF
ncbi:MAG: exodeoxyribonuclease VII large subunit [Ponticaulis sp.]|nr:exodeoxyribonuclease VII large subunit [Ponticaulis sp.]